MGMKEVKDSKELNFKEMVTWAARLAAVIFIVAISIYIIKFGVFWPISTLGTLEQFGSFGDFIGGVMNPLLQFVVIFMLLWSIQVQRQELKATRETLDATKLELSETKSANKAQASELEKQTFILRTQQQDSLDQIKVDQELMLLKHQKENINTLLLSPFRNGTTVSIKDAMQKPYYKGYENEGLYLIEDEYEGQIAIAVTVAIHQFGIGLCALLKCKNIPISHTFIELQWFFNILVKLSELHIVQYEEIQTVKSNLKARITESTLNEKNKKLLNDFINSHTSLKH